MAIKGGRDGVGGGWQIWGKRESMILERKEKRNSNRERSSVPSPRLHGKHTEGDKVQVGS